MTHEVRIPSFYLDCGTRQLPPVAEEKLDVLPEATGVVVANGPSVAEGLEDRVRLEHSLLDGAQLIFVSGSVAQNGKILQ